MNEDELDFIVNEFQNFTEFWIGLELRSLENVTYGNTWEVYSKLRWRDDLTALDWFTNYNETLSFEFSNANGSEAFIKLVNASDTEGEVQVSNDPYST